MRDFILASLSWVICGIPITIIIVNNNKVKTKKTSKETYISEGLCLGMSLVFY